MIILASSSASRKAVLASAGVHPRIIPAQVDEEALISSLHATAEPSPTQVVQALARAKAQAVYDLIRDELAPDDLIIGCDSMLHIGTELQGKPHTVEVMIERWRAQRGKTARLLSGHCIIDAEGTHWEESSESIIHFGNPTDADITAYANSGEALWCAGAFTLEAKGGWFIDSIEGDPSGVLGISLPLIRKIIYRMGRDIHSLWHSGESAVESLES